MLPASLRTGTTTETVGLVVVIAMSYGARRPRATALMRLSDGPGN
jgi:hypothetical protein